MLTACSICRRVELDDPFEDVMARLGSSSVKRTSARPRTIIACGTMRFDETDAGMYRRGTART